MSLVLVLLIGQLACADIQGSDVLLTASPQRGARYIALGVFSSAFRIITRSACCLCPSWSSDACDTERPLPEQNAMAGRLFLLTAWAAALVAAQLPPDLSTGCTSKSFSIPSWLIRNLERSTGGDVSFSLLNRATNTTAGLACSTEESGWNACSPLEGTTPSKGELEVSVQVTESSTAVRVKQTWTCDDRGTVYPFLFSPR